MRAGAALGFVLAVVTCSGCGGGSAPTPEQAAPFAAAIQSYLDRQSYGMKPVEFESLDIAGDAATARVRMADKDEAYGLRPLWTFMFEKAGGEWQVTQAKRPG